MPDNAATIALIATANGLSEGTKKLAMLNPVARIVPTERTVFNQDFHAGGALEPGEGVGVGLGSGFGFSYPGLTFPHR
jgi:hypothetical protein